MRDVVLVSMPFGPVFSPSIGLSLLQAELRQHGIPSRIEYFCLDFARTLGQAFYSRISAGLNPALTDLTGEWIFSGALFGADPSADARYIDEILLKHCEGQGSDEEPYTQATIARLVRARTEVDAFLERCVAKLRRHGPKVVGFTSLFQQHVASLSLARRVKEALPSAVVVFGGANCEGVMGAETVRQFPFVDAVVSGEADEVFPELARRALDGRPIDDLPGVRTRARLDAEYAAGKFESASPVPDLDRLPVPDYSDYFEQFNASGYGRTWLPRLFIETSRGCWWGERAQCTFCALNGETLAFRSKSPGRALDELAGLARSYPDCDIQAAENILDVRYLTELLPELSTRPWRVNLFLETKSNLKKEELRILKDAGVQEFQPGIESLSDPVLKMMRKGVTAFQNIQLLKWCRELGITPWWNFLWGFPGEPPEEYARMARVVPLLTHLPAPSSYDDIRLDRFSPVFVDASKLGLVDVAPLPAYRHVYRLPECAVSNLAYHFTFRYREARDVRAYVQPLVDELDRWRESGDRSALFYVDTGAHLFVWDLRPGADAPFVVLTGLERVLYKTCDATRDRRQLEQAAAASGHPAGNGEIDRAMDPLVQRGLLLRDGPRYLALALSLHEYAPSPSVVRAFRRAVAKLGVRTNNGWIIRLNGCERRCASHRRVRRGGIRRRVVRRRPLRRLSASQFLVDGRGRLVIRAAGIRTQDERRH